MPTQYTASQPEHHVTCMLTIGGSHDVVSPASMIGLSAVMQSESAALMLHVVCARKVHHSWAGNDGAYNTYCYQKNSPYILCFVPLLKSDLIIELCAVRAFIRLPRIQRTITQRYCSHYDR